MVSFCSTGGSCQWGLIVNFQFCFFEVRFESQYGHKLLGSQLRTPTQRFEFDLRKGRIRTCISIPLF